MNRHQRRTTSARERMQQSKPQYHWLVAAEVVFVTAQENLSAIRQNTLVLSDTPNLTMANIARAQQGIQLAFMNKMKGSPNFESLKIVDVVLITINPLGLMTQTEFEAKANMDVLEAQMRAAMDEGSIKQHGPTAEPESTEEQPVPTDGTEAPEQAEDRPMEEMHRQ